MALEALYENENDIPEAHRELFSEKSGKWELTGVTGIKTTADTDRLSTSLTKEREDHKTTKARLTAFGEMDPEQAQRNADEVAELQAKLETAEAAVGENKPDEAVIDKLVEARVATVVKPIQRDLDKLTKLSGDQADTILAHELKDTNRTISDSVRTAAGEAKIISSAMEDALMLAERVFEVTEDGAVLTRDNVGVTPGIDPTVWFTEMQEKRQHWWPNSQGGGAGGGGGGGGFGGDNPFTYKGWNMTAQGKVVREDPERAQRMAKSAGTVIGGPKPAAPSK